MEFKNLLSFDLEFIKNSSSIRQLFPIKQLLMKQEFNNFLNDKKFKVSHLMSLTFNSISLLMPDEKKNKINKLFVRYLIQIGFILKMLIGGLHNNEQLKNNIQKIKESFDSFIVYLERENYILAIIEYRKIIEAMVFINIIKKSNNLKDVYNIDLSEMNITSYLKKENFDFLLKLWREISQFIHAEFGDNILTFDLNIKIRHIIQHILLSLNQVYNEFECFLYIFNKDEILINTINLMQKYKEEMTSNNLNINIKIKKDYKSVEEYVDRNFWFNLVQSIKENSNDITNAWTKYYDLYKDEIDYCINKLDLNYQFNKCLKKDNVILSFNKLAKNNVIKEKYEESEIFKFYFETFSKAYNLKVFRSINYLYKIMNDLRLPRDIFILSIEYYNSKDNIIKILNEFALCFLEIYCYDENVKNGLLTIIVEFIEKYISSKIIKDYENASNVNIRNLIKSYRHLNIDEEDNWDGCYKMMYKIIEKSLEEILGLKTSHIFEKNNDNIKKFKNQWISISNDFKNLKEIYDEIILELKNAKEIKRKIFDLFPFCIWKI